MSKRRTAPRRFAQGVVGAGWLAVCVVAGYLAMQYDFSPGRVGPAARWPEGAALSLGPKTTVVAFLHPRCVCTEATVKNLVSTLRTVPDAALIANVFVPPDAANRKAWQDSAYARLIRKELPRAAVVSDPGALEAMRFGALTSGTVLVYDAQGTELFRGGITDRRGGGRPNPGLTQFAKALAPGYHGAPNPTPVFGCPLVQEKPAERSERSALRAAGGASEGVR